MSIKKYCTKGKNFFMLTVLFFAISFSVTANTGMNIKASMYEGNGWYIQSDILYITSESAFDYKDWTSYKGSFHSVNYCMTAAIPDNAFEGCTNIQSVMFGLPPASIGDKAFYNCTGLNDITIPGSVSSIGTSAFEGCTNLQAYFDTGTQDLSIGNRAFYGCRKFLSINLPDRVYAIGTSAFENIPFLYVKVPGNVLRIGEKAFYCSSPISSEIEFGKNIKAIGNDIVCDNSRIKATYSDDTVSNYFASYQNIRKNDLRYPSTFEDENGIVYKHMSGKEYAISGFTSKLKSDLVIPTTAKGFSINQILGGAFAGCKNINSLTIPSSYQIDQEAFKKCTSLKSVIIVGGCTIEADTFKECSSLKSVSIGGYCTIEAGTFQECSSLESVRIGIYCELKENVFSEAGKLKKVVFDGKLSSLGEGAFRNCKSLTSIKVPEGIKVLEKAVFSGCSSLINIGLPSTLSSSRNTYDEVYGSSDYVFYKVPRDVNIFCYENTDAQFIAESFGFSCHLFHDFAYWPSDNGTYSITDVNYNATTVVIPEEIDGVMISSIADSAFAHRTNLMSIELKGKLDIGALAFDGCSNLKSITFPKYLTGIGEGAFRGCTSLTSVKIPIGFYSIKAQTFAGCSRLKDIIIPGSIGYIAMGSNAAFKGVASDAVFTCNTYSMATKTLKENGYQVKEIDDLQFQVDKEQNVYIWRINNLESISIPGTIVGMKVTGIYNTAMQDRTKLVSLEIGDGILIRNGAFKDCTSLEEVYIGDDCIIEASAFEGCTSLRKIVIGNGCTIGNRMCSLDTNLTEVEFKGTVKSFGGSVFSNCSALEHIVLPEGMEQLNCDTFIYCNSIKAVTMPASIKGIQSYYGKPTVFINSNVIFYFKQFNSISKIMQDNGYHCELLS